MYILHMYMHACIHTCIHAYVPTYVWGARCSSVVRAFAYGTVGRGPIELFLDSSHCSKTSVCVLSCLWDDTCKRTLAANRKE